MLPESVRRMILKELGMTSVSSRDCAYIGPKLDVSETTAKRLFGLVDESERKRVQHTSTLDRIAKFLGYESYREVLKSIGELDYSSEFTQIESIDSSKLNIGSHIVVRYEPSREIVMTYTGDCRFIIDDSLNCKLRKGDIVSISNIVKGQEMIATDVIRNGQPLGGYRAAKDGGITSIEIVE